MTALHKTHPATSFLAQAKGKATDRCLFCGEGVEMFSSGSAPAGTSCWSGESTALFSSGSVPSARAGQATGALVELFSSGSAPRAEPSVVRGELSGLFSSGS
mgnify:FL=1